MSNNSFPTNVAGIIAKFPQLQWMSNEVVLNLSTAVVIPEIADGSTEDCADFLQFNGVAYTPANIKFAQIPISAFDSLYASLANICNPSTIKLLGLRINYAVRNNVLYPVFEPVAYKVNGRTGNYAEMELSTETIGSFVYDGTNMVSITSSTKNSYINAYKNAFKIQRVVGSGVFESFQNGTDVISVTLPFQTLYQLALDNENNTTVSFFNAIKIESIAKCSVLLYMGNTPTASANSFKGNYANRSIHCPTDCLSYVELLA